MEKTNCVRSKRKKNCVSFALCSRKSKSKRMQNACNFLTCFSNVLRHKCVTDFQSKWIFRAEFDAHIRWKNVDTKEWTRWAVISNRNCRINKKWRKMSHRMGEKLLKSISQTEKSHQNRYKSELKMRKCQWTNWKCVFFFVVHSFGHNYRYEKRYSNRKCKSQFGNIVSSMRHDVLFLDFLSFFAFSFTSFCMTKCYFTCVCWEYARICAPTAEMLISFWDHLQFGPKRQLFQLSPMQLR